MAHRHREASAAKYEARDGVVIIEGELGLDDAGVGECRGVARCDNRDSCPRG